MAEDWRYRPRIPKPYPTGRFLEGWSPLKNIANIPSVIIGGGKLSLPQRSLLPQVIGVSGPFRKWVERVRAFDRPEMMMMQKVRDRPRIKEIIQGRPLLKKFMGGG